MFVRCSSILVMMLVWKRNIFYGRGSRFFAVVSYGSTPPLPSGFTGTLYLVNRERKEWDRGQKKHCHKWVMEPNKTTAKKSGPLLISSHCSVRYVLGRATSDLPVNSSCVPFYLMTSLVTLLLTAWACTKYIWSDSYITYRDFKHSPLWCFYAWFLLICK